jgi:TetR/AcrR family transcriptional regulator, transcriptional repressor for nem operon
VGGFSFLTSIPTSWYVDLVMPIVTQSESRDKLLDAAIHLIRSRGYTATRVDEICAAVNLSKGSFFHYFSSKEDLALAAAARWNEKTGELFASASYHELSDPLERVLAYIDLRKSMLRGELPEFTCLMGTMLQETYETSPPIREACNFGISSHAATLEADIAAAILQYNLHPAWTAASLALHTQCVLQGAFILAKAKQGPAVAAESVDHLRRYVEMLFTQPHTRTKENPDGNRNAAKPGHDRQGGHPRRPGKNPPGASR